MKPAFWSDALIAELPEPTRLFYIGLWMIADDAGWLRWDAVEAARDLYGYESRGRREKRVVVMFESLTEAGRVVLHDCGHAEIPRFTDHQRLSGPTKQVQTTLNEHLRTCVSHSPAGSRGSPQPPADPRPERNGKEQERGTERSGKGNGSAPANAPNGAGAPTADVWTARVEETQRRGQKVPA